MVLFVRSEILFMKCILGFTKIFVNLVGAFLNKNGAPNMAATARMKFALEARLNQLLPLAIQSRLVSGPLWTLKVGS